ncbi:MAG: O-antigen ligase family protein, partial [Flavobacterium sp.]|nr:O-antigen ligase family protein [Flavobacterium sp.]
ASIYCYNRKISMHQMLQVFWFVGLPIICCATYLVLYTPDLKEVLSHTGSNFETSGGFGPNQVATVLGLGLFVFFVRALFASPTRWQLFMNLAISFFFTYRALLTFSRGGLLTGLFMVVILIGIVFFKGNSNARLKIFISVSLLGTALAIIWIYTVVLTGGLIEKRYANQDAQGREKQSISSGREELAISEIELFLVNPYFGGGVGSGTVYRKQKFDMVMASHNEVTRMLGEHGLFGILALLLLIITPIILYMDNKNHFFMFSLLAFWFLTLNHAAMRTAAPAFVYALTLLKIQLDGIPVIRRK